MYLSPKSFWIILFVFIVRRVLLQRTSQRKTLQRRTRKRKRDWGLLHSWRRRAKRRPWSLERRAKRMTLLLSTTTAPLLHPKLGASRALMCALYTAILRSSLLRCFLQMSFYQLFTFFMCFINVQAKKKKIWI